MCSWKTDFCVPTVFCLNGYDIFWGLNVGKGMDSTKNCFRNNRFLVIYIDAIRRKEVSLANMFILIVPHIPVTPYDFTNLSRYLELSSILSILSIELGFIGKVIYIWNKMPAKNKEIIRREKSCFYVYICDAIFWCPIALCFSNACTCTKKCWPRKKDIDIIDIVFNGILVRPLLMQCRTIVIWRRREQNRKRNTKVNRKS